MTNKSLSRFVGRRYMFKYRFPYSGIFRGIYQLDGKYGMVFTNIRTIYDEVPITIAMIIHPQQTKCTAIDDFIRLRAVCREIFASNGWADKFDMIYVPKHRVLSVKAGVYGKN